MKGLAIPTIIWIIVGLGIIIFAGYELIGQAFIANLIGSVTGQCRNIYCADYEFICCGEKVSYSGTWTLDSHDDYWQCSLSATKCIAYKSSTQTPPSNCKKGKVNCKSDWLGDWQCEDRQDINNLLTVTLEPGEYIYGSCGGSVRYEGYDLRLCRCGDSACDCGVTGIPVLGASGCSFVTNWDVYDPSGRLTQSVQEGQDFQVTVPKGNCYLSHTPSDRYVCGDTCEYCQNDDECKTGRNYIYNNKGAECKYGQLELYGCRQYGTSPTEDQRQVMPWESGLSFNYGTKCDIIQTIPIQCCPHSDDCGLNAVCDPDTFTCKSTDPGTPDPVECTADWECGTATGCTYDDGQPVIKGKACKNNKCVDVIEKTVNCCYDTDCPSGWFCDPSYTCKQQVQEDLPCPYDCCVNYPGYRDRPCPEGQLCCPDHTCKVDCTDLPPTERCNYNYECEPYLGETVDNCPDCEPGIWDYLKIFIGGLIASMIILVILFVAGLFFPPLRIVTRLISKPKNFFIAWIILAIFLTVLFAIPMGSIYASVIG